jgi:heme A synthase
MDSLISKIQDQILNPLIGLMFAIAFVVFIYGVIEYVMGAANEDKREAGKKHIAWGIVGLFIMVAVFGIMNVIVNWVGS